MKQYNISFHSLFLLFPLIRLSFPLFSSPLYHSPIVMSPTRKTVQLNDGVICGTCDTALSSDWFCSRCHRKCSTCNRYMVQDDDFCSRCWTSASGTLHPKSSQKNYSNAMIDFVQEQLMVIPIVDDRRPGRQC